MAYKIILLYKNLNLELRYSILDTHKCIYPNIFLYFYSIRKNID
jgi:hypothetical protein